MSGPRFPADTGVEEVVDALEEDGYAVIEGLLSADEVTAKREELERLVALTPPGRNDFEGFNTNRVYALFAKTRMFDDLALHPLMTGICDEMLEYYQLSAPVGLSIGPGETNQVLHHDDLVYPLPWPHQPVVMNSVWALCDFSQEIGATRLVPGSHVWPRERQPSEDETVVVEMPAGAAVVYGGSIWHGGGANKTERPRPSILMEYVASWLRPQETHLLSVPPEMARELPEELQELLGYNIYPPFVGYVDGRHPRRVLS